MARRNNKVVRYRKPFRINIGIIIFLMIFIYILIVLMNFLRQDNISIYEVVKKNISDDNIYKGIILRDETIYYTDKAGYINYYIGDSERTAKKSTVYTIDETGEIYQILSNADSDNTLNKEDSDKIRSSIASFRSGYSGSNYIAVSDFKYDIENTILEQTTSSLLSDLDDLLDTSNRGSFEVVTAKKSGIISYTIDGYEEQKIGDITASTFDTIEEKRVQLRTNDAVGVKAPVYKMINKEDWNIIILLSDEQYGYLKDLEKVNITFKKDNISTIAGIQTYESGGSYFANISLNKFMVRYINERFLELEIQLNAADGLKIPITSILEKDFFLVPNEFISVGGKTNSTGVTKETVDDKGETRSEFIPVTVMSQTDTESYVEGNNLETDNYIIEDSKNERYQLGKTKKLEGVYNVNKGYAVFRVIDKIYENNEYAIVSEDTPYGLSAYDHIVVKADSIEESALVKR